MIRTILPRVCCGLILCLSLVRQVWAADEETWPAKGIQDNSFLVEEAYNQEEGVVQHILTAQYSRGAENRQWDLAFTQEWPLFSERHQISYTVPYGFIHGQGRWNDGPGDVSLHYRYQALFETDRVPAFAPELSLILPTGDASKGLGNDTVGWEVMFPFSKVISDRWTVHANAGVEILPDVNNHDLVSYNLGGSAVYAVTRDLNLLLEWVANFDEEAVNKRRTDRSVSVLLSPGFRYALNFGNRAQMGIGAAAPIGVTHDAPDCGVFLYFSFEHFFMRNAQRENLGK